jgi:hypothetical protein
MEERSGLYRGLVGKPEGKGALGRSRRRWEDNIKMYHQEVGCGGMDWIELGQDRDRWRALVNVVTNSYGFMLLTVVQNIVYVNNSTKRDRSCVSVSTMNTFTLLTDTFT